MSEEIKSGDSAPSFSLESIDGTVSLSDFPKLILYFYSKDNTAGCNKQALSFKEHYDEVKRLGYEDAGVSKDSVASHRKFAEKFGLEFYLLSDPECTCAESYGVRKLKNMYGKKVMGTVRSAFVIENGVVVHAVYKIDAETSAKYILKLLSGAQI